MKKLKQFGIVAAIYLLLSFIELAVNPLDWSTGSKIVVAFAVFAYVYELVFGLGIKQAKPKLEKPTYFPELDEEER